MYRSTYDKLKKKLDRHHIFNVEVNIDTPLEARVSYRDYPVDYTHSGEVEITIRYTTKPDMISPLDQAKKIIKAINDL